MVPAMAASVAEAGRNTQCDEQVTAFRWMLLARMLDEKFAGLYRAGKIHGGVFLGRGQEAFSVAIGLRLKRGDIFAPSIRDTAGRLAFGEPILDGVRTYLGSRLGPMMGRDGNIHRGRPKEGLLPMISHLGSTISVVSGMLFSHRLKGVKGTVGVASIGDGATSTGAFHEALNQAGIERFPLVVALANNQYAYSTPNRLEIACADLLDRAVGYNMEGRTVDGTDAAACLETLGDAITRARQGRGPQLVIANLLRLCGHGEHDDASYVDPRLKQSVLGRDCLKVAEEHLLRQGWADAKALQDWRSESSQQIDEALTKVQREPAPDPYEEDWCAIASRHLVETHLPPG